MLQLEDKKRMWTVYALGNKLVLTSMPVRYLTDDELAPWERRRRNENIYVTTEPSIWGPVGTRLWDDGAEFSLDKSKVINYRKTSLRQMINSYMSTLGKYREQVKQLDAIKEINHNEIPDNY